MLFASKQRSGYMCPKCAFSFLASAKIELDVENNIGGYVYGTGLVDKKDNDTGEDVSIAINAAPYVICNNCSTLMVEIDEGIFSPVLCLNHNGTKTAFCCEGHANEFDRNQETLKAYNPEMYTDFDPFKDGSFDLDNANGALFPFISSCYIDIIDYDNKYDDKFFKELRDAIDSAKQNWDELKDIKYYVGPTSRYGGNVDGNRLIELCAFYDTKPNDESFNDKKRSSLLFMGLIVNEFIYLDGRSKNV